MKLSIGIVFILSVVSDGSFSVSSTVLGMADMNLLLLVDFFITNLEAISVYS